MHRQAEENPVNFCLQMSPNDYRQRVYDRIFLVWVLWKTLLFSSCPSPKPHPDAKCLTLVSYSWGFQRILLYWRELAKVEGVESLTLRHHLSFPFNCNSLHF